MSTVFERDLEFVQLLCNPDYIRWLYNNNYFMHAEFKSYLRYLLYFKDHKYTQFLIYPQCIPILERLITDNIVDELGDEAFYLRLSEDQYYMWKHRSK